MNKYPLLKSLQNPANLVIFVSFFIIFLSLNYWVMKNLPGTNGYQCLPDSLTRENMIFSLIISLIMAFFVIGMKELFTMKNHTAEKISSFSIFSIGGIASLFTIFCPICTLGVISIFGFSVGLNFFVDFDIHIKIISILLLLFGLYWINDQLKDDCKICNFIAPKK